MYNLLQLKGDGKSRIFVKSSVCAVVCPSALMPAPSLYFPSENQSVEVFKIQHLFKPCLLRFKDFTEERRRKQLLYLQHWAIKCRERHKEGIKEVVEGGGELEEETVGMVM